MAQGAPPPPPPGGGNVNDVPLDNHLWIILLVGVSYGIYYLVVKKNYSNQ